MRILMLGWEFPPYVSGGLGRACQGLTAAMMRRQARVLFVVPRSADDPGDEAFASYEDDKLRVSAVPSMLTSPYAHATAPASRRRTGMSDGSHRSDAGLTTRFGSGGTWSDHKSSVRMVGLGVGGGYDGNLAAKVEGYTRRCVDLSRRELFDIIHAHEWMTFPAGEEIARMTGRPLVAHVHATEFDRSPFGFDSTIGAIERRAVHAAAGVIAVSHRTRRTLLGRYGASADKVKVIHNGIEAMPLHSRSRPAKTKVVLFLGRVTAQKGPEYFVRAAAEVARRRDDVRFVVAGTGDLLPRMIDLASDLGVEDRFAFPGFLRDSEVERAYRAADVFVMPSVSEPFGLTALEAARSGVPVIMSKTSGVGEVLRRGALKVDCRDTRRMARMILDVLDKPRLAERLRRCAASEISGFTWDAAAERCLHVYNELTAA